MYVGKVNQTLDTSKVRGRSSEAAESGSIGKAGNVIHKKEASFSERLVNVHAEQMRGRGLSFSKHAEKRLSERGILVDQGLMGDISEAVNKAREKGARDVAVISRDGVFIVNVPHNVVVTTMGTEDMHNRIFTNIDSAVLV